MRIIAAKSLDLISESAYQEPWVVVKLGRLTSTIKAAPEPKLIKKNPNPQFNQLLDMEFEDVQAARLEVEIRDVDETGKEVVIGALRLRLQNLAKKIASVASYKLTVPHVSVSKAELELSLEAQDFDTSDGNYGMSGTSYVPASGGAHVAHGSGAVVSHSHLAGSSGSMPPPSAAAASSSAPASAVASSSAYPHAVLPSQSPVSMPHQPPSRAAIQQYPPPVNYNAKDIKRIHPHIAKGSYGVVYKGTVPDVKEVVVIKDMDFTNQKALEDWRKEIKMMAKTSCEYVVRVLGYATADRTLTIIMELMGKGSLYDVLHNRKETLSVITRMRMARHCALGLQHLHDLKVMHRDIKSMNILVNESYSCKLTDFGCAKSLNDQGHILNTANSGTPLWMAPEVKMGHYDFSADIYSLGLVIYELLEKRLPQYDQIRGQVIIPRDYDSKDIVGPCLSADPSRRPKASEIVHKLDCVIRNIITNIRKMLKEDELKDMGLSTAPDADQLDSEISALYQILLKKDPKSVDAMVYQAFGSSPEKASANKPDAPMPAQAPQQPAYGMPGAVPGFGMPMAPVGYPPGFQAAPFPMQMAPSYGQPAAYGTPPFGHPHAPINPYMPNPYVQPKPRHVQMLNPAAAYAPPTSALNPYAPAPVHHGVQPPSHHANPYAQAEPRLTESDLGIGQKSPFADPGRTTPHSPSPPPGPAASAPPLVHHALLVDDPYSDAYRRPESPVSVAHAASIQQGRFDVMKPERSGQLLLDDFAGLTSGALHPATGPGKEEKEPIMDFGDFASPRGGGSSNTPSTPFNLISASANAEIDGLTPKTSNSSSIPDSVPNGSSRFLPLSNMSSDTSSLPLSQTSAVSAPIPTTVYKVVTESAQKPNNTSLVGNLIDMDLSHSGTSNAKVSAQSNPTGDGDSAFPISGPSSSVAPQAPPAISLLDFLQSQSMSPRTDVHSPQTSGISDLLGDFSSENRISGAIAQAEPNTPGVSHNSQTSARSSSMKSGNLIDMSDFLSAEPISVPKSELSEYPGYSKTPASAILISGEDIMYPSISPAPSPNPPQTSPSAFASVQRQPPVALQNQLRRTFKEFAAGSATVDCGTAGIIMENVLPGVDGSALDASFSAHLQKLQAKSDINEEMCLTLFVHVWNDCQ